ncbi:hypothetical protein P67b_00023 [Ruegeria phage Tedan]|nr:hypothetical protein P67b_00023 [Ruegeria phage Tedan]
MSGNIFNRTARFNQQVCGIEAPAKPQMIKGDRFAWFMSALHEELDEFEQATTVADQADAIIDLMYFAAGRLHEMGVNGQACLDAVHGANMAKVQGDLAKRPGSLGHDAIKPAGWVAPDLKPICRKPRRPKILVLGHAQHGKDTVCELLDREVDLTFTSSSMFCAERVIRPTLLGALATAQFAEWRATDPNHHEALLHEMHEMGQLADNAMDLYADRKNHRAMWFDMIRWFNSKDQARLGREIFAENDIYCGLRSAEEMVALMRTGIVDHVVWVDASHRKPPESADSCTVTRGMADTVINNNGDLAALNRNVVKWIEENL